MPEKDDILTRRRDLIERLIERRAGAMDSFLNTDGTPYGKEKLTGRRLKNLYAVAKPEEKAAIWNSASPEEQELLRGMYQREGQGSWPT